MFVNWSDYVTALIQTAVNLYPVAFYVGLISVIHRTLRSPCRTLLVLNVHY